MILITSVSASRFFFLSKNRKHLNVKFLLHYKWKIINLVKGKLRIKFSSENLKCQIKKTASFQVHSLHMPLSEITKKKA